LRSPKANAAAVQGNNLNQKWATDLVSNPDDVQPELPFNEAEVMEAHLYAMKKAGYEIL
jgi:hypothetical protein